METPVLALGLMSGTSLDGLDMCLIETDGMSHVVQKGHVYKAFPQGLKAKLLMVAQGDIALSDVLRLEKELTTFYADAVLESGLLQGVQVVGCHGQTIRHLPKEGLTWQLGDVNRLTERLQERASGVAVVMDFRRRDMAAGGEGAPLVPLFHAEMLAGVAKPAALLNIGGVANVSLVDASGMVRGSDCGPGMGLLDMLMEARTGQPFDADGTLSLSGTADREWVSRTLMRAPFWQRAVPRSADRHEFNTLLSDMAGMETAHAMATLALLTAAGIDRTLRQMGAEPSTLKALLPVGGGARNGAVVKELKAMGWALQDAGDLGWSPSTVEAACFAWLAVRRVRGMVTSVPATTGARHATVGGVTGWSA